MMEMHQTKSSDYLVINGPKRVGQDDKDNKEPFVRMKSKDSAQAPRVFFTANPFSS